MSVSSVSLGLEPRRSLCVTEMSSAGGSGKGVLTSRHASGSGRPARTAAAVRRAEASSPAGVMMSEYASETNCSGSPSCSAGCAALMIRPAASNTPAYRTADGGETWQEAPGLGPLINRFRFVDPWTAYAIGASVYELRIPQP